MFANDVDVSDDPTQNAHIDVDATPLWKSWPGNNRPILNGKVLCGPDQGVIGFNIFLIVTLSTIFHVWVAARLSSFVILGGVLLVLLTLYALSRATWTEAGILPRQSFQRLQHDYSRLPVLPSQYQLVAPDGASLVTPPIGQVEVDSTPVEIDPKTGEKTSLKFCSTCKIFRPARAKHCRDCDNCVEEFDHHCPWVCNCVGKRNYRHFVSFVLCVTLLAAYVCLCCIILIAREASDSSFSNAISSQPVAACLTLFTFLLNWCLCSLSCYHIWLIGQDMTTNEHIKQQRSDQMRTVRRSNPSGHHPIADEEMGHVAGSGHDEHDVHDGPTTSCFGRFYNFFFRPVEPSYFDLRAPLGSSVFKRTLVATTQVARDEERRTANLIPIAQPVYPPHEDGIGLSSQGVDSYEDDAHSRSGSHSYTPSLSAVKDGRPVVPQEDPFDFVPQRYPDHDEEEEHEDDEDEASRQL